MLPHTSSVCLVVEKLLKIADVCVPWVHVYVCVSKMYLCVSKMYICIHENICMCDSKMYICINPCVHLCAFLRYTCVCVQVYPNLCVWVYQRCVCVVVCLFIRKIFLVHWADFVSDLSDQMLSGFFVHLFLASYVF